MIDFYKANRTKLLVYYVLSFFSKIFESLLLTYSQ